MHTGPIRNDTQSNSIGEFGSSEMSPSTNVARQLPKAYQNEINKLQLLVEQTNLEFKTHKYRPTPYHTSMASLPEP